MTLPPMARLIRREEKQAEKVLDNRLNHRSDFESGEDVDLGTIETCWCFAFKIDEVNLNVDDQAPAQSGGKKRGATERGVQGAHLNPLGLFLNPLGLFSRTSIPVTWRVLSACLPA